MGSLKLIFSYLVLICTLFSFATVSYAEEKIKKPSIDVSSLETFKMRLAHLKADCKSAIGESQLQCAKLEAELRQEEEKMKEYCRQNRLDERCAAVFPQKEEKLSYTEKVCLQNRYDKRCIRQLERNKREERKKREFCRRNPESSRCQVKEEKPKQSKTEYMAAYCKRFPYKLRCKELAKNSNTNSEAQGADFGF